MLPSATVAVPRHAIPSLATPHRTLPCQRGPHLLSKESSREPLAKLRAAVCNCYLTRTCRTFPGRTTPHQAGTRPSLPSRNLPRLLSTESSREGLRPPCCRLQLEPLPAPPHFATPCHAAHYRIYPLKRAAERTEVLSAAVCNCNLARTRNASPRPAGTDSATLGLTPKDAQHDQATSASIRFRLSVTGITSVLNRPCLGLQSPNPTSLPASLAISATSPRFSTSGSY